MSQLATNQVQTRAIAKPRAQTFSDLLVSRRDEIAKVLPKHMTPERMIKLAQIAISRTPKLGSCTPLSLYVSVMKAAELGLDCSGTLGSAYLVPFGNEAQLIIGYRGLIDLARRSDQIQNIEAHPVYVNDQFEMTLGTDGKIIHVPTLDGDPGEFRLVYFICRLKGGGIQTDVMTKAACDAIRRRSRASNSGPWVTDYVEMCRKTVVKRGLKYCPMSVEFAEAMAADADGPDSIIPDLPASDPVAAANAALALNMPDPDSQLDPAADASHETQVDTGAPPTRQEPPAPEQEKAGAGEDANRVMTEAEANALLESKSPSAKKPSADYAHVTTWEQFVSEMDQVGQDFEVMPSIVSSCINKLAVRKGWKGKNAKDAEPKFLRECLIGAKAGKWDWKEAVVTE